MTELATTSEDLSAARALVPYFEGENDAPGEYLTFRLTGFTVNEALNMVHKKMRHLTRWRMDVEGFRIAEHECTGANRGALRKELIQTLYARNFFLTQKHDQELLLRALHMWPEDVETTDTETGVKRHTMTYPGLDTDALRDEWAVARRSYTPTQLQMLERMATGEQGPLDIHNLILTMNKQENHYHAS